jgi:protein-S-isoprenylcysteine O-methyltransferase Ste14
MCNLNLKAWLGLVFLAVVMSLLIFVPAGTIRYWQAWCFLAVFLGASASIMLYLAKHDPALLRRRLAGGPTAEPMAEQRFIMLLASIGFVGLLVVPAFDHRFGWSNAPLTAVIAGDVLIAIGFGIVFVVFRENAFASARVEIAKDQRVVSTGPYARVRHPMYAGALLYLLGMPLALGSLWGLPIVVAMTPILVWRLLDEERLLACGLPGYAQYERAVPWRLIPGIF